MVNDNYSGTQKAMFVTDTADQLTDKVNAMIGFTKFKEFYRNFVDYISRTSGLTAKCLYNIVLINKCGICLDEHIKLLYEMLAVNGLLNEHVMIVGEKYEAKSTNKETRFVYVIDDEWETDDDGEYYRASDEVELCNKIRKSSNIYITSMTEGEYAKFSVLPCFNAAFPNVVTIDELTADEKIEYIGAVAAEYGFMIDKHEFAGNRFIENTAADKIEMTVRNAVVRKLSEKNSAFCLNIADLDTKKAAKSKKVSAFAELENLIGLDGVKASISEIVTFLKKRGKNAVPCLHMAFLGNPGTGKTTVARIIARIFAETGVISKNLLVETDREGLVGAYVGHTAIKTRNKIESAMGGVLFIDEAYSLFTGDHIDYGYEAVATLVKAMEDHRNEFVCILAGYTKEINAMLDMNPGLRDRVQFYIDFPDYSEAELMRIFEKLCRENKYRLAQCAADALTDGFSRIVKAKNRNFSNGRLVRKLFERVRMKQALRASNNTITDKDIEAVFAEADISVLFKGSNRAVIGFRA
jgi:AAA+ superfamily predicted ATPase